MSAIRLDPASALDLFIQYLVEVREFSPETVKSYRASILDLQRRMPEYDITRIRELRVLDRYKGRLFLGSRSVRTRRTRLYAVRSYYAFLHSRGHIDVNPAKHLEIPEDKASVRPPTFTRPELERVIFAAELLTPLLTAGRKEGETFLRHRIAVATLIEPRDTALLSLVYRLGLRRGEVALLERGDYRVEEDGEVWLDVRGAKKAKDVQSLPVPQIVHLAMTVYLAQLDRSAWAGHPALFPPLFDHPSRSHPGLGLSGDAVAAVLRKRVARAGVEANGRRLSPHTLRYSIGTHLWNKGREGMTEFEIGDLLRHKSTSTTKRYVARGPKATARKANWVLRDFGRSWKKGGAK